MIGGERFLGQSSKNILITETSTNRIGDLETWWRVMDVLVMVSWRCFSNGRYLPIECCL